MIFSAGQYKDEGIQHVPVFLVVASEKMISENTRSVPAYQLIAIAKDAGIIHKKDHESLWHSFSNSAKDWFNNSAALLKLMICSAAACMTSCLKRLLTRVFPSDRHTDTQGKFHLSQAQAFSYTSCIFCSIQHGFLIIIRLFDSYMMIAGTCRDGNTPERGSILHTFCISDQVIVSNMKSLYHSLRVF